MTARAKLNARVASFTTAQLLDLHRGTCLQLKAAQDFESKRERAIVALAIESELMKREIDPPSRLSY